MIMVTNTDDARKRLIDAALKLFTEKGYAATSVKEIVTAAGVTKPMLYYYFKNKEGIYLELMNQAFIDFRTLLLRYSNIESDIYNNISNMFLDIFTLQGERMDNTRLIYAMVYGPPQGAPYIDFDEYHAIMSQIISTMITKGIANGELEDVDASDFTTVLLLVLFFCMDTRIVKGSVVMTAEDMTRITGKIFEKIIIKRGEG